MVEDEEDLVDALRVGLVRAGYAVDVAYDAPSANEKLQVNTYDLVLLDLNLPGGDGFQLCRTVRAAGQGVRIIMVTARDRLDDRVRGLDEGADDYLVKPFAFPELLARVRALLRRESVGGTSVLEVGGLRIDTARLEVSLDGRSLALTPKEYGVLHYLMTRPGHVVSSEELLEHVWDEHADPFTNTVRVTVGNLRRKLQEDGLIETVISRGYRLKEPT
ncbi:response regulator transcription factor [Nonomuraea sp. KC401]|uniref:Response regulator transcription factor n=1 Tax=Nonomuraea longispora TaxID=1848320 RepID=A0A4R4NGN8_9ACTN|nr:response regulator [Nonomuraea sp. K271]TDC05992.1 response regulator transcription factor [Nonomuraea longispora]TLF83398.1 response regulator transcription factor [Nonomuraea sp. KC401]